MITPVALTNLAWKAYLIFMVTNLAFVPLVYFCYPETSNLTLEEVDHLFTSEHSQGSWKKGFKGLEDLAKVRPSEPVRKSFEPVPGWGPDGEGDEERGNGVLAGGEKGRGDGIDGVSVERHEAGGEKTL